MRLLSQIPIGTFDGIGPLGDKALYATKAVDLAATKFELAISITIGVMTVIGGLWFIYQMFIGAIEWLGSAGEKQALQNAQKRITTSFIGLFVIIVSYGLILAVGNVLGLTKLLNPADLIKTLTP